MPGGEDVRKVSRQDIQLVSHPHDPTHTPPLLLVNPAFVFFFLFLPVSDDSLLRFLVARRAEPTLGLITCIFGIFPMYI
jgi:hypothetical protein